MDAKFLTLNGKSAKKICRFQYTAIDDDFYDTMAGE